MSQKYLYPFIIASFLQLLVEGIEDDGSLLDHYFFLEVPLEKIKEVLQHFVNDVSQRLLEELDHQKCRIIINSKV